MHDLIRRLTHWLSLTLAPGTGVHHAGARRAAPYAKPTSRPACVPVRLPRHRSPYGLEPALQLDGRAARLVRPYLLAHENAQEQARQRYRRLALVLAADFGIDLDPHVIGARVVTA
ncbi:MULTISPECIES: hypothetical protein [Streptomyces]|uniref:Uncharacterized protein n=1 Tax=Streptomyces virginiae TaxID=1961 RepID=A0ABZ1TF63_STRVG|nr:hypothetical protein [Streptomyces virginiae]